MSAPAPRITRRPILTGALVVWTAWLAMMLVHGDWHLFASGWFMSLTMVVGSFVAGATSEGGGAVAFPVMTLAFQIAPSVARDFSLLIQSVGMTAASFTIYCLRIPVEWRAVAISGLGGAIGVALGRDWIAPLLSPAATKLFFVSTWLSFIGALYRINRERDRETLTRIEAVGPGTVALLFGVGIVGGVVSGLTGSGLDILTFSVLVLGYRLSEKVATPTSVVLMASNAVVGVLWGEGVMSGMAPEAWDYWVVCVPVVVVGAPAGAWFVARRTRHFVAGFLYLSIVAQYVAALLLIPLTPGLVAFSLGVVATGLLAFSGVAHLGGRRLSGAPAPEGA